jgi:DNA-directed RNA polymerase subunit L
MTDLNLLRHSLTKNGAFKIAAFVKQHSLFDMLEHLEDGPRGMRVTTSQIANMMDALSGEIPEYWHAIKELGDQAIDAFTVVTSLVSHHAMIDLMQKSSEGRPEFTGYFLRTDISAGAGSGKVFTNVAYAMGCFGLSVPRYVRGARAVSYNLAPVIYHLRDAGNLVHDLLRKKLRRARWTGTDGTLMDELQALRFHRVFSMEWPRFSQWLDNRLRIARPAGTFGIQETGLFSPLPDAEEDQPA